MGPLLVLVCPWFRENVTVTCKIVSFLCSSDNFLLKNVIVFFLGNQISWKKLLFWPIFTILVTREKTQKFLQHISHIHTRILLTLLTFLPKFAKHTNLSCMVSLWCESWCWFFSRHFGAINKEQNGEQNLGWNVLLLISIYTNAKCIVICKPRLCMTAGENA